MLNELEFHSKIYTSEEEVLKHV